MNNYEIVAASCQQLALHWLDTLKWGGGAMLATLIFIFSLKTFASFYLTRKKYQEIFENPDNQTKKLPAKLQKIAKKHNFDQNFIKITSEALPTAYTIGFFRPNIAISMSLLKSTTTKQLEAIVLHEIFHARKKHPIIMALINFATDLLFFLPISKQIAIMFEQYFEQSADKFASQTQGTNKYLLESLKTLLSPGSYINAISYFAGQSVEMRISAIKQGKFVLGRFSKLKIILSLVFVAGVFLISSSQQKISASINYDLESEIASNCDLIQCASNCFRLENNYSPYLTQSELN